MSVCELRKRQRPIRSLLFGILSLAAFCLPAGPARAAEPPGYFGDTVSTCTSISPVITATRTSGSTPFFFQTEISLTTGTGLDYPWDQAEYRWDFGDQSGVETLVSPIHGGTINLNDDQIGPSGFYVYRSAGTYTVTVSARVWTGSGFITGTDTETIVVSAWSGTEKYYDSAGSPTGAGTIGDPLNSESDLRTWVRGGNDRKALIKGGSTFTLTTAWNFPASTNVTRTGMRIEAYGGGARPIITCSGSITQLVWFNLNNASLKVQDMVVTGINFDAAGLTKRAVECTQTVGNNTLRDLYWDDCIFANPTTVDGSRCFYVGSISPPDGLNCVGVYKCIHDGGTGAEMLSEVEANGEYWSWVGCQFTEGKGSGGSSDTGISPTTDHYTYPAKISRWLYAYNRFGPDSGNFGYCINGNCYQPSAGLDILNEYVDIRDNDMANCRAGVDMSENQNDANDGRFDHTLIHRNAFHTLGRKNGPTGVLSDATNATPIVCTDVAHGMATGDNATISGVVGNTAANASWTVTVLSADTFSLNTSVGNGAYVSGGVWTGIDSGNAISSAVFYYTSKRMTIRDNIMWDLYDSGLTAGSSFIRAAESTGSAPAAGIQSTVNVYRNRVWVDSDFNTNLAWLQIDNSANNTILGAIRDNVIVDERTAAKGARIPYGDFTGTFDNNDYFCTADSSPVFTNITTSTDTDEATFELTFGAAAFDFANSANSAWSAPATGTFELKRPVFLSPVYSTLADGGSSAAAVGGLFKNATRTLSIQVMNVSPTQLLTLTSGGLSVAGNSTISVNPVASGAVTLNPWDYATVTVTLSTATTGNKTTTITMTSDEAGSPYEVTQTWRIRRRRPHFTDWRGLPGDVGPGWPAGLSSRFDGPLFASRQLSRRQFLAASLDPSKGQFIKPVKFQKPQELSHAGR